MMGADVILYDGTNGQAIAEFIGLIEGDGFVMIDDKPVLMKASLLEEIRQEPYTFTDLYRDSPTETPFMAMVTTPSGEPYRALVKRLDNPLDESKWPKDG